MKKGITTFLWIAFDFVLLNLCVILAVLVGKDFNIEFFNNSQMNIQLIISSVCLVIPYFFLAALFRIYRVIWKFAGTMDYLRLAFICLFSTAVMMITGAASGYAIGVNSYIILYLLLSIVICGSRIMIRITKQKFSSALNVTTDDNFDGKKKERVMIIGAGSAASFLITDMYKNSAFTRSKAVCVIDDNEKKTGKYINGIEVVGTRDDIVYCARKYSIDTIVFAVPSMDKNERAEILKICSETRCKLKSMPSLDSLINDDNNQLLSLKKVEIEDLLERVPIKIDVDKIIKYVENKTILVTGGGGSIGSELCRQIASHHPKKLIIFDVYENNAYDILNELKTKHPDVDVLALIGSVRDSKRMECIFSKYHPQIVYHAAAHKHVPLMEDSPNEAIKNNVFGTFKTASMADKYGVERFVLISTDKAVNPTNVMGASKRMCEMIVQSFSRRSKTEFVAVRFGNVLGSNGSVIPLFRKQIEAGGPVLVTHPDIIRYFMTIPEAVSLVLTAGAMAKGGEIFVLDMGKPVKIVDLAKNMIRLMGYEVEKDIKIEFIGLRPGEKLFEEMLMDEEGLQDTDNHLIHVGQPIEFDEEWFRQKLDELQKAMYNDDVNIRSLIKEIVPTYKMPVNK